MFNKKLLLLAMLSTSAFSMTVNAEPLAVKADPIAVSAEQSAVFTTKTVHLDIAASTLQLIPKDRSQTGGFSALWLAPDCSSLITISDYSQRDPSTLDKEVRRSTWYQLKINYSEDSKLKGLSVLDQGQVRNLDGNVVDGAIESMEWHDNGFLVSFDDKGDIYHYQESSLELGPKGKLLNQTPTIAVKQDNSGDIDKGLEALTIINNADLLAIWEKKGNEQYALGNFIKNSNNIIPFKLLTEAIPSGATTLTDGTVLVLEKEYLGAEIGNRIRLVTISPEQLINKKHDQQNSVNTIVTPKVLLDQTSTKLDNFEGVSSCNRDDIEWAFVISDDNGDRPNKKEKKRQRTLLLMINLQELRLTD